MPRGKEGRLHRGLRQENVEEEWTTRKGLDGVGVLKKKDCKGVEAGKKGSMVSLRWGSMQCPISGAMERL